MNQFKDRSVRPCVPFVHPRYNVTLNDETLAASYEILGDVSQQDKLHSLQKMW